MVLNREFLPLELLKKYRFSAKVTVDKSKIFPCGKFPKSTFCKSGTVDPENTRCFICKSILNAYFNTRNVDVQSIGRKSSRHSSKANDHYDLKKIGTARTDKENFEQLLRPIGTDVVWH